MNELNLYTTLGDLQEHELGIDADGDIMSLANAYVGGPVDPPRKVCVVLRKSGHMEVYEMDAVPMEWRVAKAKMIVLAAPVPEEEA